MKTFHDDIDKVADEVSVLLDRMSNEYLALSIDASADYLKGCTWIIFMLASDYYRGAKGALLNGDIISGGSLVRTQIENAADLFYILRKSQRTRALAKAYVDSIDVYRSAVAEAA
jgi:hypothetical protein